MEALVARVAAALAAGGATHTDALQALLLETGAEKCWRRERIAHLLNRYLFLNSPTPMTPSTTHRFKASFADTTAILHTPDTRVVSAQNLTDEDVPLLVQYGYGHLIEPIPGAEKQEPETEAPESEDLHKLLKADLQARYTEATGTAPDDKLTKDELIKAIQEHPKA